MPLVRTIGVLEILDAAGLILPPLTGTAPWLAIAAARPGWAPPGSETAHLRSVASDAINVALTLRALQRTMEYFGL
jgi:hypothetical protein